MLSFNRARGEEMVQLENLDINNFYAKSEKILARDAFSPDDFIKHYGAEAVAADNKRVAEADQRFQRNDGPERREVLKLATILEALIHKHIRESAWLGNNASSLKTSRYDDIYNYIDNIIEFRETPTSASYLGLAVDVSLSGEIEKKLQNIKADIDKGILPTVKYFHSEHMNIRGALEKIPRVVIGADKKRVLELAELSFSDDYRAMEMHQFQFQMIAEILVQLRAFREYARSLGDRDDLVLVYDNAIKLLDSIRQAKEKEITDKRQYDSVMDTIESSLSHLTGPKKQQISDEQRAAAKQRFLDSQKKKK